LRARRNDANKRALHKLWLAVGGSWLDIAPDHGGEPDALVGWRGKDRLIEIKNPDGSPSKREPRPNQVAWHRTWRGRPVAVVLCFDDLKEIFDE
jgi:hypothetical protein